MGLVSRGYGNMLYRLYSDCQNMMGYVCFLTVRFWPLRWVWRYRIRSCLRINFMCPISKVCYGLGLGLNRDTVMENNIETTIA